METPPQKPAVIDVEARVRGNTGPAAFAGALLVFFGFFWFDGSVGADAGLLATGKDMLLTTLRLGGLLMIAIAVWCSIGIPVALLFDGVVSAVIGAFIVLSAALMMIGEGFALGPAIYVICGAMIITTGIRDCTDFRKLPSEEDDAADEADLIVDFDEPIRESALPPLPESAEAAAARVRRSAATAKSSDSYLTKLSKKGRRTRP